MKRYDGTCEVLCDLDVSPLVSWIAAIPLSEWPQQDRQRADYPYPAMVSNSGWHGFHQRTDPLVRMLMAKFFPGCFDDHRMLSVVVAGQLIAEHDDKQSETWRARVHVPLISNSKALMYFGEKAVHLDVGKIYLVNTEVPHALANLGDSPRVHLFFDVRERASA